MAITYVSGTSAIASSAASITVSKPSSVATGDVLVAVISSDNAAVFTTPPSGWTHVRTAGPTNGFESRVYRKVVTDAGSEPASYTWSGGTSNTCSGIIVAYRGVDNTSPVDTSNASTGSGTTLTAPAVTTTRDGNWVVVAHAATGGLAMSDPSGVTMRIQEEDATTPESQVGDMVQATAGATSAKTSTVSASIDWNAFQVALTRANIVPNAPTIVTMTGGAIIDLDTVNRADWDFSDPDTGDSQSKFDLRYRLVGAATWTDVTSTTPNTYYDFAAGTFTAGDYEWQVRTYDALGDVGPYSASSFFTAAEAPNPPTITDPINGETISAETDTITWSTPVQDGYRVRRVADDGAGSPDTSTVYSDTGEVTSTATRTVTLTFDTNSRTEHLQVQIQDDTLWSSWSSVMVTVSYTAPATPTITVDDTSQAGAIQVQAAHPTPTGSQPTVNSVDVYRREAGDTGDGIRVAAEAIPAGVFTDWAVASGQSYEYRVKANGDNGTSSYSAWSGDGSGAVTGYYGGGYT